MTKGLAIALALCLGCPAAIAAGRIEASGTIEYAFAPWDDPETAVVRVIDAARTRVLVQMYIFTSRNIAAALERAVKRGVRVRVLADAEMHRRPAGNVLPRLIAAGIPVALEEDFHAAHNKVLIVDPGEAHPVVVTGSYNFTWSARRRNAENLLILRDNPALAEAYADNWERHRRRAVPVERGLAPGVR